MLIKSASGRRSIAPVGKIRAPKAVVDDVIYARHDERSVEINFVTIGGRVPTEFDIVVVAILNISQVNRAINIIEEIAIDVNSSVIVSRIAQVSIFPGIKFYDKGIGNTFSANPLPTYPAGGTTVALVD